MHEPDQPRFSEAYPRVSISQVNEGWTPIVPFSCGATMMVMPSGRCVSNGKPNNG